METSIKKDALERFVRVNETILRNIPSAKKQALYAAATAAQAVVRREIDRRVDDSRGRVKRWQEVVMGTRGGYAKVAPSDVRVAASNRKYYGYGADDVTRYLERGHGVRAPAGKNKRYGARLKRAGFSRNTGRAYVPGRMFYSFARSDAERAGLEAAWEIMDQISDDYVDFLAELD